MFIFIIITVINYLHTLLQILIIIVQSNLKKVNLFLKNYFSTKVVFINNVSQNLSNFLSKYFFNFNKSNTSHNKFFLAFYISYLIALTILILSYPSIHINSLYYIIYLHMFLANTLYMVFSLITNFIFFNFTFFINCESIYLLSSLNDVKFSNFFSALIDFEVADFYTFIILDYINNLLNFFYSIYINYLNYPVFILFAVLFFFSSFFSLLALSYLGFYGVFLLNFITLFSLWLSIIPYFLSIFKLNNYYYISLGKWMYLNTNYRINFDFLIDNISLSFSFLTLSIAVFVYLYTFSYFRYEPLVDRLIIFLNLFIISMVFLVSSANLVMLFLGWEMIGLTSFFLINFWSTRVGTLKAAFKAFSFNKASDLFLFFTILLIYSISFNLDIATFIIQIAYYKNYVVNFLFININLIDLISIFFLGCAFIKSAQIGAHIWLPDSMEAPVPASSLIHSATLVSAGIFLLLRFSVLFELSNVAFPIIGIVGSVTAFYGGLTSMYQSDTKKILAYSTISHCGFLMVVYITGVVEYVLLYLYVHGFFKAAIFMSVGNVNRFSRNNQDFKKMGNYYKFLPFDCLMCFIGLINLSGLPFTLGFYIKHLLFVGLTGNVFLYYFILINCLFGAFTGLFYSYRLFYNVFFDFKKAKKKLYTQSSAINLNSKYYSNTTILGNLSIIGLLVLSYIVSLYFLNAYSTKDLNFSNFSTFITYSAFIDNYVSSKNFLYNVSYINWFVIILLFTIFFTPWRKLNFKSKYLDFFYFFIFFFFFLMNFVFFFNI